MAGGVVAHVAVVRVFKSQETCRTLDGATNVVVGQLHHDALFVDHFYRQMGRSTVGRQRRAVGTDTDGIRTARRTDAIGRQHLARLVATFGTQFACLIGNVPMDDAALRVVRFQGSHFLAVEQQACLRSVGVAHHAHHLPRFVVPDVPSIGRQIVGLGIGADVDHRMFAPQRSTMMSARLRKTGKIKQSGSQST